MTARTAASAGLWSAIDLVARQAVQFVVSVILARLLTPADFGVVAILLFFTSLATVFLQTGLTTALVQRQNTTIEEESGVFWLNLAASLVLALLLGAIGPFVASFYQLPVLAPLMWLAAAQLVLSALAAVHSALLTRNLMFGRLAIIGLAASVVSGVLGVGAALLGYGVWALAIQILSATAATTLGTWLVYPWRPRLGFSGSAVRPLLAFGSWVSFGSALDVGYTHGVSLLVGKLYGVQNLGLYNRAANTQQLPTSIISQIIGRIALPIFSSRNADKEGLTRALRMSIALSMLLNVPAMLGLALLSREVILVLFGPKWVECSPILAILAVGGLFFPIHLLNLQLTLAQGLGKTFIKNEIGKKLLGIAFVIAGSLLGIHALAASQVILSFIVVFINARPAALSLNYGAWQQFRDLRSIALAAAAMSLVVWLLRGALEASPFVVLIACTLAGAVTYALVGWLIRGRPFMDGLRLLLASAPAQRVLRRSPASH